MLINSLYNFIYKNTHSTTDYIKKIGVKVGKNCEISRDIFWGSEPYLISIGDNCRITRGVEFITHDGGVWVLRNLYDEKEIDVLGKIIVGNNVNIRLECNYYARRYYRK